MQCCDIFRKGLEKGVKKQETHSIPLGAFVTSKNTVLGSGWGSYYKHLGGSHDRDAVRRQKSTTTRWLGKDLATAREEIPSFHRILEKLELATGLEAFLTDILQQSATGEAGSREAMFSPHIDNNGEGPEAILTAVILMSRSISSMRVLGKKEFFYTLPGDTAVFPSALFHETVTAVPGTLKLSVLFRLQQYTNTALHDNRRTTRKAFHNHTLAVTTQEWVPFEIVPPPDNNKGEIAAPRNPEEEMSDSGSAFSQPQEDVNVRSLGVPTI